MNKKIMFDQDGMPMIVLDLDKKKEKCDGCSAKDVCPIRKIKGVSQDMWDEFKNWLTRG